MLLSELFAQNSVRNLPRPAIRFLGKETNYGELRTQIARLSYLYQHDLGQGARVGFFTRNSPAFISTFFALANTRAVTIPIDPSLPPDDVIAWLKRTEATHLAVTSDLLPTARDMLMQAHFSLPLIEIEKKQGGEYDTSYSPPPDNRPVDTDTILVLRTAGSAGKPKPVAFTHKQLCHAATSLRGIYHLSTTDRFLVNLNWAHPFAFVHGMLMPIMTSATCIVEHGLEAAEFINFLAEARVTRLVGLPLFFLKLLVTCRNEKRTLPPMKSATIGLGPVAPELRKALASLKIPVVQCYGMTENAWTIALEDPEETADGTSHGAKGLPGLKYKVLDDAGDTIESKEERTGLLAVSGPTVMQGYPGLEKETKSALRGTWLYTGDIAKLSGDSDSLRIEFVGRKEDLIWADNEPVPFRKINAALRAITGVHDAATFAVSNTKGEKTLVCAVVKVTGSALSENQVREQCAGKVPGHHVPKFVAFTDHIPRDVAGNILHHRLRGQFSAMAG